MRHISSSDNKIWKQALRLHQKKERDQTGLYLIEGPNLIHEAWKNGIPLEHLLVSEHFDWSSLAIDNLVLDRNQLDGILEVVSGSLFQKLSDTITPQGILGVARKSNWTEEQVFSHNGNVLVLDRIQDPGNLGTILRTADAAGIAGVLVVKGSGDLYGPKAVRAAAGSLFRVPVRFVDSPQEAGRLCATHGKRLVCTTASGSCNYFQIDLRQNIALVMGNEGNGISQELLDLADTKVRLPMTGNIESLNVAVAAGILLYESVRQNQDLVPSTAAARSN